MVHSKFAAANDAPSNKAAMPANGSVPFSSLSRTAAAEHHVASKDKSGRGFCWRDAVQVEAIFPALFQELPERDNFRGAPKLVSDQIVFIKDTDRLPVIHYRRDMRTQMHDCAALQILCGYLCFARHS